MSVYDEIKTKASSVRGIDLKAVLHLTGAIQDTYDRAKWHTCQGVISICGQKFMNWNKSAGGGGAIDLIMHLYNLDFKTAVLWLADRFSYHSASAIPPIISALKPALKLPQPDNANLGKVTDYLTTIRHLPVSLINTLIIKRTLYADPRSNAVFLLLGKGKRIVGAELRGTSSIPWRGMAPGSQKNQGYFSIQPSVSTSIVLCESAIDALSLFTLHPYYSAISTSGAHPNPAWLQSLINRGFEIFCGFDSDETGDNLAGKMIALYPKVKRLRPCKHDWNEVLISKGSFIPFPGYH
jgi:hypothetical protein